jgi:hypothetical protein
MKKFTMKVKLAAFNYLTEIQKSHSKVKDILYENLAVQKYMVSPLFDNY